MTAIIKKSGGLAWLTAALGEQRNAVASLLRRLTGLGAPGGMKSSVFKKFLMTLEQISIEKDKECEIISRIQALEERHRFQRGCKKLKHASCEPKSRKKRNPEIVSEPECDERSSDGWFAWVVAYLLLRNTAKPQK